MNFGALEKDYASVTSNYSQLDQVTSFYIFKIFLFFPREIPLKIMAILINQGK